MTKNFRDSEFYENETIIGISDTGIITDKQKKEQAYQKLMNSRKAISGEDCVLTGKVAAIKKVGNHYVALANYEMFKVIIFDDDFMDFPKFDPEHHPYPSEQKLRQVYMSSCIGAKIDFSLLPDVVQEDGKVEPALNLEECTALCSRKVAMDKIYRQMWMKRKDGSRVITEGRAVAARVFHVSNSVAFMECFGVEIKVPITEVSWTRIGSVRDKLAAGMEEILRIKKIDYAEDEAKNRPEVIASIKEMKENPREKLFDRISVNEEHIGTITNPYKENFFVELESGMEALCQLSATLNRFPMKGDRVKVVITEKNEHKKMIYGKIKYVLPSFQ